MENAPVRASLESALLVPVPEAEPYVGSLRDRYDRGARLGIPAHITLIFPFAPPDLAVSYVDRLATLFNEIASFDFSLIEVRRFPATAYLHPDKPEPFVQMTKSIVAEWPDYPPFGGRFPDIVPHLTVADQVTADVVSQVDRAVRDRLPIHCHANHVWLMANDERGLWRNLQSFPLRSERAKVR